MSDPSAWTLCIDFGTAFSKAAAAPSGSWSAFQPGFVRPLMLGGANAFLLDSAVFVDDDRLLFGAAAIAREAELSHQKRMALRSFKTLLSVSDLDRALNTSVAASIDPNRTFAMGDLIVIYLAYLTASIERALALDPVLAKTGQCERRYAAPAWRGGDSAGLHAIVTRLFGEAEAASNSLGADLLRPEGPSIEAVRAALAAARARPRSSEMGLIYEATAAAAYTSIGVASDAPALIVVDMGAGTTDIAVLARAGAKVEEFADARVTLKQAGDYIDRIIANLIVDGSPKVKTTADKSALWRASMVAMRELKESLFADGRAAFRYNGRVVTVTLRMLERDKDFRSFMKVLEEAYDHGLAVARDYAVLEGRREIQAIAVGGGAAAPFIQALIRRKAPGGKAKVTARPATPEWAHAAEFRGNLAPVFPQLAIAIGGALAPATMLAARG